MSGLKPCPFCGVRSDYDVFNHYDKCYLTLLAKRIDGMNVAQDQLTKAWNTRTPKELK